MLTTTRNRLFAGGSAALIMLAGLAGYATSPAYADPAPSGLSVHHMDTLPVHPSSDQYKNGTVTVRFRYDDAAPASGRGFVATIGEGASFESHSWSMREPVDNTPIGECSTPDSKTLVCSEDARADGRTAYENGVVTWTVKLDRELINQKNLHYTLITLNGDTFPLMFHPTTLWVGTTIRANFDPKYLDYEGEAADARPDGQSAPTPTPTATTPAQPDAPQSGTQSGPQSGPQSGTTAPEKPALDETDHPGEGTPATSELVAPNVPPLDPNALDGNGTGVNPLDPPNTGDGEPLERPDNPNAGLSNNDGTGNPIDPTKPVETAPGGATTAPTGDQSATPTHPALPTDPAPAAETATPSTTVAPAGADKSPTGTTTATVAAAKSPTLAKTGASFWPLAGFAVGLAGIGGALLGGRVMQKARLHVK
nr:hypothetical protein [uncultured Actinomyces sp.]